MSPNPIGAITVAGNPNTNFNEYVIEMSVNLTLDEASEIQLTVFDPNLQFLNANYFQIRQTVEYSGMRFEIAAMEVSQGSAGPLLNIQCRPSGIQELKRRKIAEVLQVATATNYAAQKARDVGLAFFGEDSAARKVVNQVNNDKANESVWDVLGSLANELGFVKFETDNRLFFSSEAYLLGKFGISGFGYDAGFLSIPIRWNATPMNEGAFRRFAPFIPGPPERPTLQRGSRGIEVEYLQRVLVERASQSIPISGRFTGSTDLAVRRVQKFIGHTEASGIVDSITWKFIDYLAEGVEKVTQLYGSYYMTPLGVPNCRISDDAYVGAEASFTLERQYGRLLRPGMTVDIQNVPLFSGYYLVTSVSWREGTTEPVSISARTLVEPKPNAEDQNAELERFRRSLSLVGGGLSTENIGVALGNEPFTI